MATASKRAQRAAPKRQTPSKAKTTAKAASAARKARRTTKTVERAAHSPKPVRNVARKLAVRALKRAAGTALESGATALRAAIERTTHNEPGTLVPKFRRLPIQLSVDIAVPVSVAWDEWMAFELIPEGVHRITDIERDRDELIGTIDGPGHSEWSAEVLDEREHESFAWHSLQGSDCAGLITFHRLSERLTRLELNLDVVPTNVAQAMALASHLADHHAEADLRRLKARLELINPDLYEADDASDSRAGGDQSGTGEQPANEEDA